VAAIPPSPRHRRAALAAVVILTLAVAAVAPFAAMQLPEIGSFVPVVEAIILATDLTTAILLFTQFSVVRSPALLMIANGYLFSALIVVPHALTYPGAFAPSGLLGGGLQTTPWLYIVWHSGFPVAVIGYTLLKDGGPSATEPRALAISAMFWSVFATTGAVFALTLAVTFGESYLPVLLTSEIAFAPAANAVTAVVFVISAIALLLLWTRGRAILDLWLAVTVYASVAEAAMVSFLIASRFSLGFYYSRAFSVIVSTIVLIILLSETMRLYANLWRANQSLRRERESKLTNVEAAVAAIAHEVRQPLGSIANLGAAAQVLLKRTPADLAEVYGILEEITDESFRASKVFENIRALFRSSDRERRPADVNELVRGALQVAHGELEHGGVVTNMQLSAELPRITGNSGQLQEVILNLVQNAVEAMGAVAATARRLGIKTERLGGGEIAIVVEDSGPGIDPDKIDEIFEPFVTTKAKGVGLGLAICRMIVERHGGQLSASSERNAGARFQIVLPVPAPAPP
jgi:signal transduction histidine kinase